MESTERDFRRLRDRLDIQDVLLRYAHAVDRRDLAGVAACFAGDAAYRGGLSQTNIADALVRLEEAFGRYERTMHFMSPSLVQVAGDEAHSETYALAQHLVHRASAQAHLHSVSLVYRDDLVRREGRWVIVRRETEKFWEREERL